MEEQIGQGKGPGRQGRMTRLLQFFAVLLGIFFLLALVLGNLEKLVDVDSEWTPDVREGTVLRWETKNHGKPGYHLLVWVEGHTQPADYGFSYQEERDAILRKVEGAGAGAPIRAMGAVRDGTLTGGRPRDYMDAYYLSLDGEEVIPFVPPGETKADREAFRAYWVVMSWWSGVGTLFLVVVATVLSRRARSGAGG